jgi:hypothetical protein
MKKGDLMVIKLYPKGGNYCELDMMRRIGLTLPPSDIVFQQNLIVVDCGAVHAPAEIREKAKGIRDITAVEWVGH